MNKRVIAFLCALALVVGLLPAGAVTIVSAETNKYQVGYAKVNINPWTTDSEGKKVLDTSLNLYLSGNGNDEKRRMTELYDDNGDTKVDDQDGLFATATVITDYTGKTVVYITIDSLQGYDALTTDVRAAVMQALPGISKDQIMISASHTHSSFQLEHLRRGYYDRVKTGEDENGNALYEYYDANSNVMDDDARKKWTDYYEYIVEKIKEAALEAWHDRAAATMSKGTVNANTATKNLGYNKDQDGNPQGYHMNAIRHYEVTVTADKYKQGLFVDRYDSTVEKKYIIGSSGDPFNKEDFKAIDSSSGYTYKNVKSTYKPVEVSDNNMHVLLFKFPDDATKKPIAFVNWRAHTTANSSVNIHALSSDYVNGLRTTLNNVKSESAPNGYRVAFFQGAAGNVAATAREEVWSSGTKNDISYTATDATYKDWQNHVYSDYGAVTKDNKTFIYGRMLAEVAEYCIDNCIEQVDTGEIRTHQVKWHGDKQLASAGLQEAAKQINTDESNGITTNYPYRYECDTDGDGKNETYIVNGSFHKKSIINRSGTYYDDGDLTLELNVIKLGDQVAFVTAPNELEDKYYTYADNEKAKTTEKGLISATTNNDWNNLLDDTYGTPFVLGYTNGSRGYIGNWLDYTVNSSDYTKHTDFASGAESIYSPGTYESYTSRFAQGEGEELIARYKTMLDSFKGTYVAECEACNNEKVEWFPIYDNGEYNQYNGVKAGHYYLAENITDAGKDGHWSVGDGSTEQTTCIDLMGHAKTSTSRNFNIKTNATLNLMDSVGGAEVQGQTYTDNAQGGNIYVGIGGTFNLYGGTLSLVKVENDAYPGVGWGGVVYLHNTTTNKTHPGGSMNMYGGTVIGADMVVTNSDASSYYKGCGGAIYVRSGSALNVHGGTITSGSVPDGKYGPCVFVHDTIATVTLSGDADVENVCFAEKGDNLIIKGEYTGTAGLTFLKTLQDGLDIGNCIDNASLSGANITCTNAGVYGVYIDETNLKLSKPSSAGAILCDSNGAKAYETFDSAMKAYDSTKVDPVNGYIKLMANVSEPTINKNVAIDLNGYVMSDVKVSNDYTLYGMDSQTDDYTVADEEYGKITKGAESSGKIDSVPAEYGYYLMITEGNDTSFHRYNLQVHTMTLRPNTGDGAVPEPGVYYKSYFAGDEKVKEQVNSFGVALSVYEMPEADNMNTVCKYSAFTDVTKGFNSGSNSESYTGTLLKGIMKGSNTTLINSRNANMDIYGRAYIKLKSGGYLFGEGVSRNLQEQIELADNAYWQYTDSQKKNLVDLCNAYHDGVTKSWNISNIQGEYRTREYDTYKVLLIGQSVGQDSVWLLQEVLKTEMPGKNFLVADLYESYSLEQHKAAIVNDAPDYNYHKITNGRIDTIEDTTIEYALEDEQWDLIIFNDSHYHTTQPDLFADGDVNFMINYIRSKAKPGYKLAFNATPSLPTDDALYPSGFTSIEDFEIDNPIKAKFRKQFYEGFKEGENGGSRNAYYKAVCDNIKAYIETNKKFDYVLHGGTAIQYATETHGVGETVLYRDYIHLSDLGRLMVAYQLYAQIAGLDKLEQVKVTEIPANLRQGKQIDALAVDQTFKDAIIASVNWALANPNEIPEQTARKSACLEELWNGEFASYS